MSRDESYERYQAEAAAEYERLRRLPRVNGLEAVAENAECERCGKRVVVVYARVACTLGYPGHPGAEFTQFQVCADCA
jgi:hypothetical protein